MLPARTDTAWWGDVMRADEIRIIRGRIYFDGPTRDHAPFPSCIVIWGIPRVPTIKVIDRQGAIL